MGTESIPTLLETTTRHFFQHKKLQEESNIMRVVNSSVISIQSSNNSTMPSNKSKKSQPIVPKIPRGLRSLPVVAPSSNSRSDFNSLKAEAAQIEEWWSSPRWRLTKRVYSGEFSALAFPFLSQPTVGALKIVIFVVPCIF